MRTLLATVIGLSACAAPQPAQPAEPALQQPTPQPEVRQTTQSSGSQETALIAEPAPLPAVCTPTDLSKHQNRPLIVPKNRTIVLGRGPHQFSFICLEHGASLRICDRTTVTVDGVYDSVIGARGIGPYAGKPVEFVLRSDGTASFYVLFDNKRASMRGTLDFKEASVTAGLTGKTGVHINKDGGARSMSWNLAWGDTHNFPKGCRRPKQLAE